jgi:hypothetical protein
MTLPALGAVQCEASPAPLRNRRDGTESCQTNGLSPGLDSSYSFRGTKDLREVGIAHPLRWRCLSNGERICLQSEQQTGTVSYLLWNRYHSAKTVVAPKRSCQIASTIPTGFRFSLTRMESAGRYLTHEVNGKPISIGHVLARSSSPRDAGLYRVSALNLGK